MALPERTPQHCHEMLPESNLAKALMDLIYNICPEITHLWLLPHLPGANELSFSNIGFVHVWDQVGLHWATDGLAPNDTGPSAGTFLTSNMGIFLSKFHLTINDFECVSPICIIPNGWQIFWWQFESHVILLQDLMRYDNACGFNFKIPSHVFIMQSLSKKSYYLAPVSPRRLT